MPQRRQGVTGADRSRPGIEQRAEGRNRGGIDVFLGDDGLRLPSDHMNRPPVTSSVVPVIYEDRSEARKSATFATSSGSPARDIGISDIFCSQTCSGMAVVMGERINPG